MPLLDHFRPPINEHHRWESFHSNWGTRIADALNEILHDDFLAEEQTHSGRLEIDIATYELSGNGLGSMHGVVALRLTGDTFVPVDLEASYSEACTRRRIG